MGIVALNLMLYFVLQTVNIVVCTKSLRTGRDALEDEYPYVVTVELKLTNTTTNALLCSGCVLTPTWTLTTARCVSKTEDLLIQDPKMSWVVYYGLTQKPSQDTAIAILSGIVHPRYAASPRMLHNDIGLLRTDPITLKQFAKLSAVDMFSMNGYEVELIGFKSTNDTSGKLKRTLQISSVVVKTCEGTVTYPGMCLARSCSLTDACHQETGGIAIHSTGVIALLASGRKRDCLENNERQQAYQIETMTSIVPYIDWIHTHIKS
ncbi:transmembrane protease serine 3-like [Bombyx mori]|uniref:Peptidase S1 domain-containing protein n=1 Tax=Bombyx mori TaxID=7091 RepID=A0A8R2C5R9_BOMMO|nr:transmembrane protease serine 3-like [Bombyx mori]